MTVSFFLVPGQTKNGRPKAHAPVPSSYHSMRRFVLVAYFPVCIQRNNINSNSRLHQQKNKKKNTQENKGNLDPDAPSFKTRDIVTVERRDREIRPVADVTLADDASPPFLENGPQRKLRTAPAKSSAANVSRDFMPRALLHPFQKVTCQSRGIDMTPMARQQRLYLRPCPSILCTGALRVVWPVECKRAARKTYS